MIKKTLIRGLKVTLPLFLTLGLVIWIGTTTEAFFRKLIEPWFPFYFPGLGALVGLFLVFLVGLLINAWMVQIVWNWIERLIEKIPIIKTIYSSFQDGMKLFGDTKGELGKPVALEIDGVKLLGFVTVEEIFEDKVAVYCPMSYQLGGYTIILPRSRVTPLSWTTQETMKFILSAGVAKTLKADSKGAE
jgi:uncharacterized membrane protein